MTVQTLRKLEVKDASGSLKEIEQIVPNRWQGECNCAIGPFSSQTVADYFANAVIDFGQYESFSRHVFVKGDSWYVEVQKLPRAPTLNPKA